MAEKKSRKRADYAFDVLVIGGGSAGVSAAVAARDGGAKKVAIIEEKLLGGECPHEACVPTKALLAGAKMYHRLTQDPGLFGVHARGVSFDWGSMQARKRAVVETITGKGKRLEKYLKTLGVTVIKARAFFEDPHTVRAGSHVITAKSFVIATGSEDIIPPVSGIEDAAVLSYRDLLNLERLPRSLAIIGAGPVGAEFATLFAELGVKVALIHRSPHILSREDEELALMAEERLKMLGVTVLTNTTTLSVKRERRGVRLTYQVGKKPRKTVVVDEVAVAVGKRPRLSGLKLEKAELPLMNGAAVLDAHLRTKTKHIFVAGDATPLPAFTSTAHAGGAVAGFNAANMGKEAKFRSVDFSVVPHVTFIDPEFASVGLTQKGALELKFTPIVYKAPLGVLARAAIDGKREGMLKVIVDSTNGKIIGAHMLGERAGEVIHELALAMAHEIPFSRVQSMLHAYPTYSEIISAAMPL